MPDIPGLLFLAPGGLYATFEACGWLETMPSAFLYCTANWGARSFGLCCQATSQSSSWETEMGRS